MDQSGSKINAQKRVKNALECTDYWNFSVGNSRNKMYNVRKSLGYSLIAFLLLIIRKNRRSTKAKDHFEIILRHMKSWNTQIVDQLSYYEVV